MPNRPFYCVAHRGDSEFAPENTMPSFEAAIAKGADELELDIHATKDGVPVVIHDASLKRTAGRDALVKDTTFAELRALDAGVWKSVAYAKTRVPTVDEVFETLLPRIPLQIELKAPEPLAAVVERMRRSNAFERVLVTSFHVEYLEKMKQLEPRLKTGWLLDRKQPQSPREVKARGCAAVLPHCTLASARFCDEAHELGMAVRTWGGKTMEGTQIAISAGADGITCDDPAMVLTHLKNSGLRNHALPLPPMASVC